MGRIIKETANHQIWSAVGCIHTLLIQPRRVLLRCWGGRCYHQCRSFQSWVVKRLEKFVDRALMQPKPLRRLLQDHSYRPIGWSNGQCERLGGVGIVDGVWRHPAVEIQGRPWRNKKQLEYGWWPRQFWTTQVKKGDMACNQVDGLSGAFIPVSEMKEWLQCKWLLI